MPELNEPQTQAVLHSAGPLLVFAGAGSGKTRTITYRIANLISRHAVPPYRLLAVTFTNKAAGEMRARLEQIAGTSIVRDLWVGTFHSVCARLLRRYHAEASLGREFLIYDESDQKAVVARAIKTLKVDEKQFPPKAVLSRIHVDKREGRGPDAIDDSDFFARTHRTLYEAYQSALRAANAVDFEDLIVEVMRIAENPNTAAGQELRQMFDHVLVDEFQDTNLTQYRLLKALSSHTRNLCVVGDDDQSIYRWRGADVRIIRNFRRDFSDATIVKLEQNYRSTANIVRAALGVIEPSEERVPKKLWTDSVDGAPIVVHAVRDERDEAAAVATSVAEAIASGTPPTDIAVFYRVHAQSRVIEEAFRADRIPYQIIGGTRFFDRAEVKDALAYLRLVENPRSDADLLRIINVPTRGIGAKTIEKLFETAAERGTSAFDAIDALLRGPALASAAKRRLAAFRDLMEHLRQARTELGPRALGEQVLERTGYRALLRQQDTAESDARLENLEELLGSLSEYEYDAGQAGEPATLSGYLERVCLVAAIDSMRDTACVLLMTVHAAKGLEFDSVFITGMEEEVFPYRGVDGRRPDELEEERRLAYVAITRARRQLVITHAMSRTLFGRSRYLEPSRFLGNLPPAVVEHVGNPECWPGMMDGRSADARWGTSAITLRPGERFIERDEVEPAPSDEPGVVVRPGDAVLHKRFGKGVVERVEMGVAPAVVARFPGFGVRKVLAQYLSY